jgi:cell filamentation protein
MPGNSDPYLYPGTDVLRNLADLRDPVTSAAFEANATAARLIELAAAGVSGGFDVPHLKTIHRHLFQDVYSWAGDFRTVNISKGGHLFGAAPFLEAALTGVLSKLAREGDLSVLAGHELARAGFYLGEINAANPFREGNGRTQREFIRQLCWQAGFPVDWSGIAREAMTAASRESSQRGDNSGLAELILKAIKTGKKRRPPS